MLTSLWLPFGEMLFGLWLFGWLPAKPPRWLTQGPAADPAVANPAMARVAYLSLLTLLSLGPFIWIDTARLRRRLPVFDLPAMARLVLASRRGAKTFLVMGVAWGVTAWFVARGMPLDSYFVRIPFVLTCGVLMIVLLPPAAVVLASSAPDSGKLLETTARQLHPFRVVSLLDGARLGPSIFTRRDDNLRTLWGESWRAVVHRLVEITPLVIVDARSATPHLCEEIAHMLNPRLVGKALFVVNDDGSAPGLEAAGAGAKQSALACCPARDMPRAVESFKATGAVSSARSGDEGGVEIGLLTSQLGDRDERVYQPAASTLAGMGAPAIETLARILADRRRPPLLRYRAAVALGRMACDFDPACLLAALGDPNPNVQQGAAWAVGERRVREAVPLLASLLNDPGCGWHTKTFAVEALGSVGGGEARAALSAYLTRLGGLQEALDRGETRAPELRLLREYLGRRQAAFGGDPTDPYETAGLMNLALRQFGGGVRAALERAGE